MTTRKVAVISAGDSSAGIDAAWQLSADGFEIAILSSSDKGQALARDLNGISVAECYRSAACVQRLVDRALDRWGRVDVLVNSAECQPAGSTPDGSDRDLHAIMDAYLMDIVRPTRVVAPAMAELGGGIIVNVVNLAAVDPDKAAPALNVFQAAMANFCNLMGNRYAAASVKMANIVPDTIGGPFQSEEHVAGMPICRFGKVEEISGLVTCLVADPSHMFRQSPRFDGRLSTVHRAAA